MRKKKLQPTGSMDQTPKLWGICAYFNPGGYKTKRENYSAFRRACSRQNLPLITVELSIGNQPFQLEEADAQILVQVHSDSTMWHKERLLNIALAHVPASCQKIVWLDCDILFMNDNWVDQTSRLLDDFAVVQPFAHALRLPAGSDPKAAEKTKFHAKDYPKGRGEGKVCPGLAYSHSADREQYSASGFAWAMRKEIVEGLGFYDKMILGSGDFVMAQAFIVQESARKFFPIEELLPDQLLADLKHWQDKIRERVNGNVGYCQGLIVHLYHGRQENRLYNARLAQLTLARYDPKKDLRLNAEGCWEWKRAGMNALCKFYFWLREEDNDKTTWRTLAQAPAQFIDRFLRSHLHAKQQKHSQAALAHIPKKRLARLAKR